MIRYIILILMEIRIEVTYIFTFLMTWLKIEQRGDVKMIFMMEFIFLVSIHLCLLQMRLESRNSIEEYLSVGVGDENKPMSNT